MTLCSQMQTSFILYLALRSQVLLISLGAPPDIMSVNIIVHVVHVCVILRWDLSSVQFKFALFWYGQGQFTLVGTCTHPDVEYSSIYTQFGSLPLSYQHVMST